MRDTGRVGAVPHIDVVGLGPGGPDLITARARALLDGPGPAFLRTNRHPAASAFPGVPSFDGQYERGSTFDDVYRSIVDELIVAARQAGSVVYAVPGSPAVAERTVVLLRRDPAVLAGEVTVAVHPAVSFLDIAFTRLGVDPVATGVRMVDGESFAVEAAGERGPLLVAQCWSRSVLSGIKLAAELPPATSVTVLHHLGLEDEAVWDVAWDELDRSFDPDHLTSLWVPEMAAPVAVELLRLDELVRTLRERCPWDRRQTHGSLARHLLEESYEVLEAIDAVVAVDALTAVGMRPSADPDPDPDAEGVAGAGERAVAHLEEELGDLLFQVYFHAALASEAGRFTLADVARGVHDKLVSRHPHVFGDVVADTPEEVAINWEMLKKGEKNRSSVTEGIPAALPALALATKLQRKGLAVGVEIPGVLDEVSRLMAGLSRLERVARDTGGMAATRGAADRQDVGGGDAGADGEAASAEAGSVIGEVLFSLANVARILGVDPEAVLRSRAAAFRSQVEALG